MLFSDCAGKSTSGYRMTWRHPGGEFKVKARGDWDCIIAGREARDQDLQFLARASEYVQVWCDASIKGFLHAQTQSTTCNLKQTYSVLF